VSRDITTDAVERWARCVSYLVVRTRVRRLGPGSCRRPAAVSCRCSPVARSLALSRRFPRRRARRLILLRCIRRIPRLHVHLGRLRGLIYSSRRGGDRRRRTYVHFMRREPWLTCDVTGQQLYILGGRYRVTQRGIEG